MIFEMRGTVSTVHLLAVFYLVQEVAMGRLLPVVTGSKWPEVGSSMPFEQNRRQQQR